MGLNLFFFKVKTPELQTPELQPFTVVWSIDMLALVFISVKWFVVMSILLVCGFIQKIKLKETSKSFKKLLSCV